MYYTHKLVSSDKSVKYFEHYNDLIEYLSHQGWYQYRREDCRIVQNLVRTFNELSLIRWEDDYFYDIIQRTFLVQTYSGDIVNPDKIVQDVHTLQNKRWREYNCKYLNIFRKAPIPGISNGRWHFMCWYKTPKIRHDRREVEKSIQLVEESGYQVKLKNNHKYYEVEVWDDNPLVKQRSWKKHRKHQYKD